MKNVNETPGNYNDRESQIQSIQKMQKQHNIYYFRYHGRCMLHSFPPKPSYTIRTWMQQARWLYNSATYQALKCTTAFQTAEAAAGCRRKPSYSGYSPLVTTGPNQGASYQTRNFVFYLAFFCFILLNEFQNCYCNQDTIPYQHISVINSQRAVLNPSPGLPQQLASVVTLTSQKIVKMPEKYTAFYKYRNSEVF